MSRRTTTTTTIATPTSAITDTNMRTHTRIPSLAHSHTPTRIQKRATEMQKWWSRRYRVEVRRFKFPSIKKCGVLKRLLILAGDKGSRITLIGLAANVGLTVSKGAAGWYMNSASLLADAGHTAGGTWQPISKCNFVTEKRMTRQTSLEI